MTYKTNYHNTIKFTYSISPTGLDFLDVHIYKGPRFESSGILDFRPHFKDMNCFQYLHYTLAHPRSTFSGIVKGELLRILRASSSQSTAHVPGS